MESCQICFEPAVDPLATAVASIDTDTIAAASADAAPRLVRELCGSACPAKVCASCLAAHVRASLDECYAGILPRVRCPICLTRLNKVQWAPHLPTSDTTTSTNKGDGATNSDAGSSAESSAAHLVQRYQMFCRKACSLQSPCCHKIDYSHLPDASLLEGETAIDELSSTAASSGDSSNDSSNARDARNDNTDNSVESQVAPEPALAEFLARCREFCFHRGDGRTLVQFALEHFDSRTDSNSVAKTTETTETMQTVLYDALARITDDERRATLLLSFLYARPAARTRCCQRAFCFNCKRNGHHTVCERESEVIDEDKCVARCRSCRVMIVKVEGCDSVACVCGFTMGWERELAIQRLDRRGLVAVDIFDRDLYERWELWRAKAQRWGALLQQRAHERHRRAWIAMYAPLLRKHFGAFLWQLRAKRRHDALQCELFWHVYDRTHPQSKAEADDFVAALFAINVGAAA